MNLNYASEITDAELDDWPTAAILLDDGSQESESLCRRSWIRFMILVTAQLRASARSRHEYRTADASPLGARPKGRTETRGIGKLENQSRP